MYITLYSSCRVNSPHLMTYLVGSGQVHVSGVVGVAAHQVLCHPAVAEGVAQPPPLYEYEDRRDDQDGGDDGSCSDERKRHE